MVEHVCDIVGVLAPICYKSCSSALYHLILVLLIPMVGAPDGTTAVKVGFYHEVCLGLDFSAGLSEIVSKKT